MQLMINLKNTILNEYVLIILCLALFFRRFFFFARKRLVIRCFDCFDNLTRWPWSYKDIDYEHKHRL